MTRRPPGYTRTDTLFHYTTLFRPAGVVRLFADLDITMLVSSSFSKSFSLYGERVGALTVVAAAKDEGTRVLSQIKRVIRANYSRSEEHTSELQSLMRISYSVLCLKKNHLYIKSQMIISYFYY